MKDLFVHLEKINYWKRKPDFKRGFIRTSYLDAVLKLTGNKLIKVLTGQRRSGKSYLVRQIMEKLIVERAVNPKNVFYLDMEMFEFQYVREASGLYDLIKHYQSVYSPEGRVYLFIDEVQNVEQWEKTIVSLAQHPLEDFEIFITGSNSKLLSGELATLLSGRYVLFQVYPFSYPEFLQFKKLENNAANFKKYLFSTGMPEALPLKDQESKRFYFQSLKDTILLKDIMHRHKIRDYVLLEDIYLFLVHNTGNLTSVPAIIKYFKSKNRKVDYTTVSQYIMYMKEAFLIHEASRYLFKRREILSGEKKYYLNDAGFRNYLFSNSDADIASLLENVVFIHLKAKNYEVKVGYVNKLEVDFYAEKGKDIMYIQVAYLLASEETVEREFKPLEKIKDNYPKYVLTMDELLINHSSGILHQNIYDFIYKL